jgi:adenosine deaminase CECR1
MRALLILLACATLARPADFAAQFEQIRNTATPAQLYALLYDLPKGGDLHHHFTLSHRPADLLKAATSLKNNRYFTRVRFANCPDATDTLLFRTIQQSTYNALRDCVKPEFQALDSLTQKQQEDWTSALILDKPGEGRNEFFELIVARLTEPARDPELSAALLDRLLERYSREGLTYLETQAHPLNFQDAEGKPVPSDIGANAFRKTLAKPQVKRLGVETRFLTTAIRFAPNAEQTIARLYDFIDHNRDLWVGLNLAGREDNGKGYPLRFVDTFRQMRRQYSGIHLSIHGGELDNPGPEVRQTLFLGAERIGHGLNLITDPDTMLLMRNGPYLVESALVSNRLLEYTPDLSKHPFIEYLRQGIPVCLNTDDAGVWDSNLTDEYFTAVTTFKLTWKEVVQLGRNSLQYSFADAKTKTRLLEEYDRRVHDFERRYGGSDWVDRVQKVQPDVSGYARRSLLR